MRLARFTRHAAASATSYAGVAQPPSAVKWSDAVAPGEPFLNMTGRSLKKSLVGRHQGYRVISVDALALRNSGNGNEEFCLSCPWSSRMSIPSCG